MMRKLVEDRLAVLHEARVGAIAKVNHIDGAIAELEYILSLDARPEGLRNELCAERICDGDDRCQR